MNVSVIIVNYNVKYFLEQCLCSVKQALAGLTAEVFVVDNYSTDNSICYLKERFPFTKFIVNKTNLGFAKANNIALRQCSGKYVLFLNPDTIIPEQIISRCLQFFKSHPDAGAIGVKMLDGNGIFLPESKRAFPSPWVSFFKLSGLASVFPKSKIFNRYALGFLDKNKVHIVDVLSGAFLMAERKLLLKMDGFDEAFFMYGEDIDLSYRIQQEGKKNYYLGNLCIIHFKGESAGKNKPRHTRIFYNAMNVFVKKHFTGLNAWALKVFLYTGIAVKYFITLAGLPIRILSSKITVAVRQSKRSIYLIGDVLSTREAEKIILKHKLAKAFKGTILIDKKEYLPVTEGCEIVFCIGHLSYGETIKIAETTSKKNDYKWHGKQSSSIAGSSDKKYTGTVYYADDVLTAVKA